MNKNELYKYKYLKYKNKYLFLNQEYENNNLYLSGGSKCNCLNCLNNNNCLLGGSNTENKVLAVENNKLVIKPKVMLFKADWCPYCTNFLPEWNNLTSKIGNKVDCIKYDSDKDQNIINKYNIEGFPTIKIEYKSILIEYKGKRTADDIISFLQNNSILN